MKVTPMRTMFAIALGALLSAACAVGPNYRAPPIAPAQVRNAQTAEFAARTPEALWWQEFEDPELDALVARALAGNLDLRSAYDRVKAARAVFVERKLDYAPHVQLDGTYTHFDEQEPGFGTSRFNAQSDSLGFDATWELDLFGRVRRSVEAARADLGSERANYQDAQVTAAAGRRRAAAHAGGGVAADDLFPRVNVTGFIGFLSGDVGQLFATGAGNN